MPLTNILHTWQMSVTAISKLTQSFEKRDRVNDNNITGNFGPNLLKLEPKSAQTKQLLFKSRTWHFHLPNAVLLISGPSLAPVSGIPILVTKTTAISSWSHPQSKVGHLLFSLTQLHLCCHCIQETWKRGSVVSNLPLTVSSKKQPLSSRFDPVPQYNSGLEL